MEPGFWQKVAFTIEGPVETVMKRLLGDVSHPGETGEALEG